MDPEYILNIMNITIAEYEQMIAEIMAGEQYKLNEE